ncbi:MAG: hypothetical protein D6826_02090 [Alphaproteobacteria bacterium]|nr:MAG: hypothetical protein D6826_02090 [Alphaproteobacteria bacterium]
MTVARIVLPMMATLWLLAACTSASAPKTTIAPPEDANQPDAGRPATAAPSPAAPASQGGQGAETGGIIVRTPGGAVWIEPETGNTARQADIDACYHYAHAQITRDRRMETDSSAAFDAFPSGLGLGALRQRMSAYEQGNRQASLFEACMESKGYAQR